MQDTQAPLDLSSARSHDDWLARLEARVAASGLYYPLDPNHTAVFADGGNTLLVTFETIDTIRSVEPDHMPLGLRIASRHGWSSLVLVARTPRWFRDTAVLDFFDAQIDAGFFDSFERVIFYGAGMSGYAACALSICAPGAIVLAVAPQATLEPQIAPWDRRFPEARRLDFTSRFGFAPAMLDGSRNAFIVYDAGRRTDSMHATLFRRPFVTLLRAAHLGSQTEAALRRMGVLETLIETAARGRLTPARFHDMLRRRRNDPTYLCALVKRAANSKHPSLTITAARHALALHECARTRKELARAEKTRARSKA
ncbi:MAG: phosphoadenosine phosphosulfate reductase [Rhodobacteraceae bacterium]|nr:MAG: phosphoadenosine phosphosulfate reductase [Paracoccaceae bacterium]